MKNWQIILLSGMLVLGCAPAQGRQGVAEGGSLQHPAYTLDAGNGLPQGFVTGIVQDRQGFIWLGTRGGLVRYDGYTCRVFKNDPLDSNSLASDIIFALQLDRENRIWIFYEGHRLDLFDPATGAVRHVGPGSPLSWLAEQSGEWHCGLYQDRGGRYWTTSVSGAFRHFTLEDPRPVPVSLPAGSSVTGIQEDQQGQLWVCTTRSLGIIRGDTFVRVSDLPVAADYNQYRLGHMAQDADGNWVIGHMGCVEIYHPGGAWTVVPTPFPAQGTRFVLRGPDGKIYLNAANEVFRLDSDRRLSRVWRNPHVPGDLQSMAIDRSNVLWVGTNTFGARLINLSSRGFHSFPYRFGFLDDVLYQLGLPARRAPYRENVVSYLFRSARDRQGHLWFANLSPPRDSGRAGGSLTLYRSGPEGFQGFRIRTRAAAWLQLAFDAADRCWAILRYGSTGPCVLARVHPQEGVLEPLVQLRAADADISYLTRCGQGLCVICRDRLCFVDPSTGTVREYPAAGHFSSERLLMAVPDPSRDSVLWLATMGGGIVRLDARSGAAQAFTTAEGLPDNTVYAILPDAAGYFWCSSNKGIFRFCREDGQVLSFTQKDGLQGNEFNRFHFLAAQNGEFFFGGTQGWTAFYPDSIRLDVFRPPAVITDIRVDNRSLSAQPGWKDTLINTVRDIRISPRQHALLITFAGLQFNLPGAVNYRYRLEGFDEDWVYAGEDHTVHYTNLSPGRYVFRVCAANMAGAWGPPSEALTIHVRPPWWGTWWALALFGLAAIAAVYAVFLNRTHRLRIRHAMALKDKEAEQWRTLDEMKSRFFSNITHELRTPLSLILGSLEQSMADRDTTPLTRSRLSRAQRHARELLQLINQLLDLSKTDAGRMPVTLARGHLEAFIGEGVRQFDEQAGEKAIKLRFDSDAPGEFMFDADKWHKILVNLVSNALKFTPGGGRVTVSLTARPLGGEEAEVTLRVSDNGIGMEEDELPLVFQRFYQADDSSTRSYGGTGIGLALVKELTELMGGRASAESRPGEGSVFQVVLPLRRALLPAPAGTPPIPEAPWLLPQEEPLPELPRPLSPSAALVLVVEDHRELNHFIGEALGPHYRVMTAYNGQEALEMARTSLPDLIVSDIMMPGLDGYGLCEAIKRDAGTSHIAVILLSAKASPESILKGLQYAADEYLTKPFSPAELQMRVQNLLAHQQRLKTHYQQQFAVPDAPVNAGDNPFLCRLYAVLDAHLDDESLNVEKLAEKMHMHRRTLNRKLEAVAGLSAGKIIRQYRLKKAAGFLAAGYNVSETAYKVGFDKPSYFSMSFKEFYGVAPSIYAQRK